MSDTIKNSTGLFFSFIGAVSIVWFLWHSLKRSEDPAWLVFKWILTVVAIWVEWKIALPSFGRGGLQAMFGLAVSLFVGLAMTATWRGAIVDLVANPLAALYDGGTEPPEPKPAYSAALGKRQKGRSLEAILAVREQLAKFPNDFEGVMLLASIQAEDTKDLASAEITFNHFCDRPNAPLNQVVVAFTQIADWHLKIAQDTDSARAWLEKIIVRFPDSAQSLAAAQRIAHLGGTEKILLSAHDRQPVPVPEGVQNIGLLASTKHLLPAEVDPAEQAAEFVKHLEQHPHDTEVREKLAMIYADHYQRLDLATMELEQMITQPNHPPKRVAHWLHLLANLQIRHGADYATVRATLQKIVEQFPDLPVARSAESRLATLRYEINGQKETPGVKLGVYEQNIGLKYGSPRQF